MPSFQIAPSKDAIDSLMQKGDQWITVTNYHKIVDLQGKTVGEDYAGHKYELILKQEKVFSYGERFMRAMLATFKILKTLGFFLIDDSNRKWIREQYFKEKKTFRLGLAQPLKGKSAASALFPSNPVEEASENPTKLFSKEVVDSTKLSEICDSANQEFASSLKANKFLEDFKKSRGIKVVFRVIVNALADMNGDGFKLIAEEITENEIQGYLHPKNDCFALYKSSPPPLEGLFKYFSVQKLKIFLGVALNKCPLDYVEKFFRSFVVGSTALPKEKQQEVIAFIVDWLLKEKVRSYVILPKLQEDSKEDIEFLALILANISKQESGVMLKFLGCAYNAHPVLLAKAAASDLQVKEAAPNAGKIILEWIAKQNSEMPKLLNSIADKDEAIAEFNKCRTNPAQVRLFLKDTLKNPFPLALEVIKDMTVEEVITYSTMENDCFEIFPKHSHVYHYKKNMSAAFAGIAKDQGKLLAFIKTIIQREDCKGKIAFYVALITLCNQLKQPHKKAIFANLIKDLNEVNQVKKIFDQWQVHKDVFAVEAAMVEFAKNCHLNGLGEKEMGWWGAWVGSPESN